VSVPKIAVEPVPSEQMVKSHHIDDLLFEDQCKDQSMSYESFMYESDFLASASVSTTIKPTMVSSTEKLAAELEEIRALELVSNSALRKVANVDLSNSNVYSSICIKNELASLPQMRLTTSLHPCYSE